MIILEFVKKKKNKSQGRQNFLCGGGNAHAKQTEVLGYKDFLPTLPQHRHLKLQCWSWLINFKQK